MTTAWLMLLATIVFEVAGLTLMKLSDGMANLWPTIGMFACYALAFAGLSLAVREIDLSIAYAIWSATGTALVAVIGVWAFGEQMTPQKLISLVLVIAGVVGLKMSA